MPASTPIRDLLHATDPYAGFAPNPAAVLTGWHSTDPLFGKLVGSLRPRLVIEVGTWKGGSAITMAGHVARLGLDSEIVCVDTWLGACEFWLDRGNDSRYEALALKNGYPSVYYDFLSNVVKAGHASRITPFPQSGLNAARWFAMHGVQADLIYIDASHEEADVLADILAYWPLLRVGGVIFGDDYSEAWPSVKRGAQRAARRLGAPLQTPGEFWVMQKNAAGAVVSAAPGEEDGADIASVRALARDLARENAGLRARLANLEPASV